MKWYVLNYNFNEKKVEPYNIFNSVRFNEGVERILKEGFSSREEFIEKLDVVLKSAFWSRREWELSIGDAFDTNLDNYEKIDAYAQLAPNIEILADFILNSNM